MYICKYYKIHTHVHTIYIGTLFYYVYLHEGKRTTLWPLCDTIVNI